MELKVEHGKKSTVGLQVCKISHLQIRFFKRETIPNASENEQQLELTYSVDRN